MLEILNIQQVAQPLPDDAHEAIVSHLEEWPRDPTIVTGVSPDKPGGPVTRLRCRGYPAGPLQPGGIDR